MTIQESPSQLDPSDQTWHEIEGLVEEIARLSKSDLSAGEFQTALVDRSVSALAAVAGAVWMLSDRGQVRLAYQINLAETGHGQNPNEPKFHETLVAEVLETGKAKLVPPHSGSTDDTTTANPTAFLLILCPLKDQHQTIGVLELVQPPGSSPATHSGYLQVLEVICELACDFHQRHELRELRDREQNWARREDFSRRVHQSLDLDETVYTIVNDARQLIECDRVSLLVFQGSRCRMSAISGVDTVDRRATIVRRLEALATLCVAADEPLWYGEGSNAPAPEVHEALDACLDASHARLLAVVPLREKCAGDATDGTRAIGALVIERFAAGAVGELQKQTEAVCRHSAVALGNAVKYQGGPLVSFARRLTLVRRLADADNLPKTTVALIGVLATVLALVFVPADFAIEAAGELQPQRRREVFAPIDGVVDRLAVTDHKIVAQGEILAVLRSGELDLELSRLDGEVDTTRKKLDAVRAARLENIAENSDSEVGANRLTADEEELKQRLAGLNQQRKILQNQREKLTVRSPLGGQVLTWNLKQLLEARPVSRGQAMLSVADLNGPWVLEVRVPDDRIGHVLQAQERLKRELAVTFVLATEPGVRYSGTVVDVAMTTEVDEGGSPSVLVTVSVDRDAIPLLRPGATVLSKIHCGSRSIGYVWLHDLLFAVQSRLMF